MINQTGKGAYGYVALAHAIIRKGETENDQLFLQSDWHDWLVTFCRLGDKIVTHTQSKNEVHIENV